MKMQYESPESSSPLITRSVAAGLIGRQIHPYRLDRWQALGLDWLGNFPQTFGRVIVSRFSALSSINSSTLSDLDVNTIVKERLADYTGIQGPFPVVTMGASLGGAAAHLALALGGPFLPQTFVLTLRGGSKDGDVQRYFHRSADLAQFIAARNKNIITIQHYDPVHDEWLTRYANHLRFKLTNVPQIYQDYLKSHLAPGGTVCYLDCQATWLRYQTGERSYFQIGGWGDISPEEFLSGSPRIHAYTQAIGLGKTDWQLSGFPLQHGPESEWGCEPATASALQAFCQQEGFKFIRISLPSPHDFTRLAFFAQKYWLESNGRIPAGVLVEMFSQFDAMTVLKANLLPVWLVFNTSDSLKTLSQLKPDFPPDLPVWFAPLATFTRTPDLVPWESWKQALAGCHWVNIGTRPSHYPGDTRAVVKWLDNLHQSISINEQTPSDHLPPQILASLARQINVG